MDIQRTVAGMALHDDEEILHNQKPSWLNWLKSIVFIGIIGVVTVGFGLVLLYFPWRARQRTRYVVTSDRVIVKKSTWRTTDVNEYPITHITSTKHGSRLLGAGYVEFAVSGHTGPVVLGGIRNSKRISNDIQELRTVGARTTTR